MSISGYQSSTSSHGTYSGAPRKPLLRSVALPQSSPMSSPTAPTFQNRSNDSRRFSWLMGMGRPDLVPRSQTPAPPVAPQRDPSFREVPPPTTHSHSHSHSRTRKSSVSSNHSDSNRSITAPLKGILKKTSSSRSSTPAPAPAPAPRAPTPIIPPEPTYSKPPKATESIGHHRRRSGSKGSSSESSSRPDGYSSDSYGWKQRKVSPVEQEAFKPINYNNGKVEYQKVTKVPMKSEAISLSWPLTEATRTSFRNGQNVYFDLAFDPREGSIRVPIAPGVAHRVPMGSKDVRMDASSHCVLTEMLIYLDDERLRHWPIKVQRKRGIRCLDVFEAIYNTLQGRLTNEDERAFGEARIQQCFEFWRQRCADSPGLTEHNMKVKGMRRVDLLRGRRIFRGLKQSNDEWILYLDDYTGSSSSRH